MAINDDTSLVDQNTSGGEEATNPHAQITSTQKANRVGGRMVGIEIDTVAGHVTIDEIHQSIDTLIVQARSAVEEAEKARSVGKQRLAMARPT